MMYFCPKCRSRTFTPTGVTVDFVQCGNCHTTIDGAHGVEVKADGHTPREWSTRDRMFARAALPLPPTDMRAMFDMLRTELPHAGCDHTRRLTLAWLAARGLDAGEVGVWLDYNGGACDCETLATSELHFLEAMRDPSADVVAPRGRGG